MSALIVSEVAIPTSAAAVASVTQLETLLSEQPQQQAETHHLIHGGMYCRTMVLYPQYLITGALVKVSTTLIISGHVTVYIDEEPVTFNGYYVLPASAGRKQAILAHTESYLTMLVATDATSVAEAEAYFTDEVDKLASHKDAAHNRVIVTGV
jgi:hypothetical protein|tara:strand:- start:130 stop:588 length:459 start_codon:yes stop_codon:yes gene_type:complete